MTTIYFIRHAQSDYTVEDEATRPLTEKGMRDRELVTDFLMDKGIDIILSSPFKRAVDTISDFAEKNNLPIHKTDGFRERKSGKGWMSDAEFRRFAEQMWSDFNCGSLDDECLGEVQKRNIAALDKALAEHCGKNIVIGTHGLALSSIINYYDSSYGFDDFMSMYKITPWVVKMCFNGIRCVEIQKIDLFNGVCR